MTATPQEEPHVPLADVETLFDALIGEVKACRLDTRSQVRRFVLEQLHGARAGLREAALGALVNDAMTPDDGTPPSSVASQEDR